MKLTAGLYKYLFYIIHLIISVSEILSCLILPFQFLMTFAHGGLFAHVFSYSILGAIFG